MLIQFIIFCAQQRRALIGGPTHRVVVGQLIKKLLCKKPQPTISTALIEEQLFCKPIFKSFCFLRFLVFSRRRDVTIHCCCFFKATAFLCFMMKPTNDVLMQKEIFELSSKKKMPQWGSVFGAPYQSPMYVYDLTTTMKVMKLNA